MGDFVTFSPGALRKGAEGFTDSAQGLDSRLQALLSEVGDVSALGTNDTLGSLASMVYGVILERVQETSGSISDEYDDQAEALAIAARAYASVEQENAELGGSSNEVV